MDANPRNLDDIFEPNIQYQIPLFQRPYVWEKEQWEPLWIDIQGHMARMIRKEILLPHFMGAVVFERSPNPTGSIQIRSVIDGQQRLTTLQILLMAARDAALARGQADHSENFDSYVTNDRKVQDKRLKQKVYPSNADRDGFDAIHGSKSPEELAEKLKKNKGLTNTNIIGAYNFYSEQIANWADGEDVDGFPVLDMTVEQRFALLWTVCSMHLLLVVVDIDADKEDSQVIFETLNARGTPLLPADLIKNFLFRGVAQMAQYDEESLQALYDENWKPFDQKPWRKLYRQGRLERPKIDTFINHYLSMRTRDDIRTGHLFVAFKQFCETALNDEGQIINPDIHIKDIARFADTFLKIVEPSDHPELERFMTRLAAVDTATVYPFLLYAYDRLMPDNRKAFNNVLGVLEAFLVRRMITDAGTKAYNRLFVDLTKAADREDVLDGETVARLLLKAGGESSKFPTDEELHDAIFEQDFYYMKKDKVRAVLQALDLQAASRFSEAVTAKDKLTIEHLLPQTWETHWPLPEGMDELEKQKAITKRNRLVQSIGNLTLITGSFNAKQQNYAWSEKKPELIKFSKLNLTQYFHDIDRWDEDAINTRTDHLFEHMKQIWPYPSE